MDRNSILQTLNMPYGKQVKDKLNEFLNDHVNVPLSEAGHPDTGAAVSSILSSAGELVIPDTLADAAMAAIPMGAGKLMRLGKGMSKIVPGLEEAGTINYGKIKEAEQAAKAAAEEEAPALKYYKNQDNPELIQPGE